MNVEEVFKAATGMPEVRDDRVESVPYAAHAQRTELRSWTKICSVQPFGYRRARALRAAGALRRAGVRTRGRGKRRKLALETQGEPELLPWTRDGTFVTTSTPAEGVWAITRSQALRISISDPIDREEAQALGWIRTRSTPAGVSRLCLLEFAAELPAARFQKAPSTR